MTKDFAWPGGPERRSHADCHFSPSDKTAAGQWGTGEEQTLDEGDLAATARQGAIVGTIEGVADANERVAALAVRENRFHRGTTVLASGTDAIAHASCPFFGY